MLNKMVKFGCGCIGFDVEPKALIIKRCDAWIGDQHDDGSTFEFREISTRDPIVQVDEEEAKILVGRVQRLIGLGQEFEEMAKMIARVGK